MFPGLPPLALLGGFSGGVDSFGGSGLNYGSVDKAIQQFEGWFPGSPSYRNNNPGNIVAGNWALSHGATGSAGGFATFPTESVGFAATDALVTQYANNGASLRTLINSWSPPGAPGNSKAATDNYVNFVSNKTGINPDTPLKTTQTSGGIFDGFFGNILNNLPGGALLGPAASSLNLNPFSSLSWGRVAAFLLGLILIAGGIMMFKPAAEFVIDKAKLAGGV